MEPYTSPGPVIWVFFFPILIVLIFFFQIFFCLCRSHGRQPDDDDDQNISFPPPAARLDPALFKFLPTFTYSSAASPPPECVICLMEFQEGDQGRVLPNCKHMFHRNCIDTWFRSHCNCPLCRAPVEPPRNSPRDVNAEEASASEGRLAGSPNENLPPPSRCPRKPLPMMELAGIIVEIRGEDEAERISRRPFR